MNHLFNYPSLYCHCSASRALGPQSEAEIVLSSWKEVASKAAENFRFRPFPCYPEPSFYIQFFPYNLNTDSRNA